MMSDASEGESQPAETRGAMERLRASRDRFCTNRFREFLMSGKPDGHNPLLLYH